MPRNVDQAATNREFCWMKGPSTTSGRYIGLETLLILFLTYRLLLFSVSLCLCPPGKLSRISTMCHERSGTVLNDIV